ncbi:MAG: hypothetical protein IJ859_12685 [Synergistaceae bacterium]|nr:hypothetical protein [Synergistaceae bacterium]MBR2209656.1 hypothetical protein [Synergistaceae bacterium]
MAVRGLITLSEAAAICNMTRQGLHLIILNGDFLTPMKIGHMNVWDEEEVKSWYKERLAKKEKHRKELSVREVHRVRGGVCKGEILSKRQTQILTLYAAGLKKREIAKALGISSQTIPVFLQRIYSKLNVDNKQDAITRAIDLNLIEKGE